MLIRAAVFLHYLLPNFASIFQIFYYLNMMTTKIDLELIKSSLLITALTAPFYSTEKGYGM
jgi:hypothetical protein